MTVFGRTVFRFFAIRSLNLVEAPTAIDSEISIKKSIQVNLVDSFYN